MIEELKMILEMVGDVSGIAAWLVGGFITYKFIIYASTTGAIVYILKLAIERLYSFLTAEKVVKLKYREYFISEECENSFASVLRNIKNDKLNYIHPSDIDWLISAIEEKRRRDGVK